MALFIPSLISSRQLHNRSLRYQGKLKVEGVLSGYSWDSLVILECAAKVQLFA